MTALELRRVLEGVADDTQVLVGMAEVDGFWETLEIVDWDADEQTGAIILQPEEAD